MVEQLTLGLVIGAAAADSINPCVFGVLIFLMAYMVKVFKSKTRMLISGLIYVVAVYVTYLAIGFGILGALRTVFAEFVQPFYWFAAIVAILAGLFEVKDYFWYGRGFSLQILPGGSKTIKKCSAKMASIETRHPVFALGVSAVLGSLAVLLELPCTGAPYLAVLGLLAAGEYSQGVPLLLLYNLIFILPLFIIIGLVYTGKASKKLESWRKEHRGLMRLGIGLFLLALGAYMIWSVT